MKEKEKKSNSKNYLVQGSILAVASIIAKIIGMIYRFSLTNTLGNEGNSYYSTANEVYNIVLMIPLSVCRWQSPSSFPSGFIRENLKMRTEFFCARCVLH